MVTEPQRRALEILERRCADDYRGIYPWELAREMWPDSPGWDKRARLMGRNHLGALGATMPMKAARLLWTLKRSGYVFKLPDDPRWFITESGRRAL